MTRLLMLAYGAVSYFAFLAAFIYLIVFLGGISGTRSVDHAVTAPLGESLLVDLALLALFGVQHSVMARRTFKRSWTRLVPTPIERSTYVLLSSLVFGLMFWQWRSIPAVVWAVPWSAGRWVLWALFALGWAIGLAATVLIDHFELFGLRQVYAAWREKPHSETGFRAPLLYRLVRHPLMLGLVIAFWAVPTMTAGHLVFSAGMTAYILVALQLEERDLIAALGEQYRQYRRRVPMLVPRVRGRDRVPRATVAPY